MELDDETLDKIKLYSGTTLNVPYSDKKAE